MTNVTKEYLQDNSLILCKYWYGTIFTADSLYKIKDGNVIANNSKFSIRSLSYGKFRVPYKNELKIKGR